MTQGVSRVSRTSRLFVQFPVQTTFKWTENQPGRASVVARRHNTREQKEMQTFTQVAWHPVQLKNFQQIVMCLERWLILHVHWRKANIDIPIQWSHIHLAVFSRSLDWFQQRISGEQPFVKVFHGRTQTMTSYFRNKLWVSLKCSQI